MGTYFSMVKGTRRAQFAGGSGGGRVRIGAGVVVLEKVEGGLAEGAVHSGRVYNSTVFAVRDCG